MIQGKFAELKILVAIALFLGGETASSQSFPVLLVTAYLHFANNLKGQLRSFHLQIWIIFFSISFFLPSFNSHFIQFSV